MGLTRSEFLKLYPALEPWTPTDEPVEQLELRLADAEQLELFRTVTDNALDNRND